MFDSEVSGFARRHIGPSEEQKNSMLSFLGYKTLDDLADHVFPQGLRSHMISEAPLEDEHAALTSLRALLEPNRVFKSMIGMGYYGTKTPAVLQRHILENPGWYTAYTPYQAEVSQGRLEMLMTFQHMITDLTCMDVANASLLDEATAAAEALSMSKRLRPHGSTFCVDVDCHPHVLSVVKTRAHFLGVTVEVGSPKTLSFEDACGVLLCYPGSSGQVRDFSGEVARAHACKAVVTFAADLLALTLLTPPGVLDADIVVGSCQRFGVPLWYGGPHAAFFATRDAYKRKMPGRLVGLSVDAYGQPALRTALQTREQHIRREKATSNICTSQVLLALMSAGYGLYHGPEGLKNIAQRVHGLACRFVAGLRSSSLHVVTDSFFDTVTVQVPDRASSIVEKAQEHSVNLRLYDKDHVSLSFDELSRDEDVPVLWSVFGCTVASCPSEESCLSTSLQRQKPFMDHPIFQKYRSETEMMRYLRRLCDRDIGLQRSIIPLGSCTMKLNAAVELLPLMWPQLADLHPFVPQEQARGYRALIQDLERRLCALTGFDAFSFQPNSGSQGEYAGLLAVRRYHESCGHFEKTVCLIPTSAHGTNPSSAVMAGFEVVSVACDAQGNVDREDLKEKIITFKGRVGALMLTYPSTHGVFESGVLDICDDVRKAGGQVYVDGANLNSMLGFVLLRDLADVSHVNLHKTFCVPHGGGGPGAGPIGVRKHLIPFLPDHAVVPQGYEGENYIAAAPWGSAGILVISWIYLALMGTRGVQQATLHAVLSANYVAKRLQASFPILYTGAYGLVAHECLLDMRSFKKKYGVTVQDIAKRLMDYGFHAPTVSFPVSDTMMIEPTESESQEELDRFCEAMLDLYSDIHNGRCGVLKNAPHGFKLLAQKDWPYEYSQKRAFFPLPYVVEDKFWPYVGRVDDAYGDRVLVCRWP